MTHDNGNTNETCSVCGRLLSLQPIFISDAKNGSGPTWVLGHFCGVCRKWGTRLPGTWATHGLAERALEAMR